MFEFMKWVVHGEVTGQIAIYLYIYVFRVCFCFWFFEKGFICVATLTVLELGLQTRVVSVMIKG